MLKNGYVEWVELKRKKQVKILFLGFGMFTTLYFLYFFYNKIHFLLYYFLWVINFYFFYVFNMR
jgi:hypothetical protein